MEEADKCREQPGRLGALLRREGLYSSHLSKWRQQRAAGQLAGLEPQKRGRKTDEAAAEISQLRQDKARLEQQLAQAELIIEAQKKLSELLGLMVAPAQAGVSSGRPS
ncbi:MAG: transposase [Anaerolineae bacterium]|nr:transposase [Anaerolineae bacterium]MBX3060649.1 transposase [Anaerolineae bacterium]